MESVQEVKLGEVMRHRKAFVQIDDRTSYKRCRVQLHARGIALRDVVKGSEIRTKQQQVCKTNDFVVAEMDAKFGGYGAIREELEGAIVSSHYFLFEPDPEKLSIDYLELLCQTDLIQSQIKATGSTNYAAIRPYHILEITISLPDLPTQKAIVARLQALQALHREADTALARLKADVKRLRQSILQDAIQGKLVDYTPAPGEKTGAALLADIHAEKERRARAAGKKPDAALPPVTRDEMPFDVPEGWVWCRLAEVLEIVSGVQKGKAYQVNTFEVPYLRVANVQRGWLDLHEIKTIPVSQDDFERLLLKKRDILMTEGGDPDKLGRCAIWNEEIETCIHQNHIFRGRIILQEQNEFFLMSLLNSPYAIKYFLRKFKQMTNLASVSKSDLCNLPIPLPPISIQNLILKDLETRLTQCDQLDQQLTALQTQTERLWKSELQQTFKFESL